MISSFPFRLILGSASPRRRELLSAMGFDFEIRVAETDETAPAGISAEECVEWVARSKAEALLPGLAADELLITADTEVWQDGRRFGKPADADDALVMLQSLVGREHQVISGFCLCTRNRMECLHVSTHVFFRELDVETLRRYIADRQPFDKAGAYGIREWIGMIGINRIEGSYYNVMGLPTAELWEAIERFKSESNKFKT